MREAGVRASCADEFSDTPAHEQGKTGAPHGSERLPVMYFYFRTRGFGFLPNFTSPFSLDWTYDFFGSGAVVFFGLGAVVFFGADSVWPMTNSLVTSTFFAVLKHPLIRYRGRPIAKAMTMPDTWQL